MMRKFLSGFLSVAISASLVYTPQAEALPIPLELFREAKPRTLSLHIPLENNAQINKWIRYFSVDDRERFDRFMQRGALYKTLIQDILTEYGVPAEMYYLAMIESGFASHATSRTRAVGIWQFMRPTARLYGLRVDQEIDERLDVIRSTRAAARHLRDLRNEFGNWYLAMAGYNCGIGCVRRAVSRGRTRDFWSLARRGILPAETVDYVPKFQAAMRIARAPERYGFNTKTLYHFPVVTRMKVPARTHLAALARRHRVPVQTLTALNPHLIRGKSPSRANYEIWLPRAL